MKVLIIEDDVKLAGGLKKGLTEQGFVVDLASDGEEGLHLALHQEYDLVIVDVMLPSRDGWSVVRELRRAGRQTLCLMLTGRDSVNERVKGLDLGADAYLVKPFAFSELLAISRSLFRRGPTRQSEVLRVQDLEIDLSKRRAIRGGKKLELTAKEFSLLVLLARKAGEVVSRSEICEQIWDMNFESDTNVVDVHIRRLRSKVDDPFPIKLILTVRGMGYVLKRDA